MTTWQHYLTIYCLADIVLAAPPVRVESESDDDEDMSHESPDTSPDKPKVTSPNTSLASMIQEEKKSSTNPRQ